MTYFWNSSIVACDVIVLNGPRTACADQRGQRKKLNHRDTEGTEKKKERGENIRKASAALAPAGKQTPGQFLFSSSLCPLCLCASFSGRANPWGIQSSNAISVPTPRSV